MLVALRALLGASVLGDAGVAVGARPASWSTAGWMRKTRVQAAAVLQHIEEGEGTGVVGTVSGVEDDDGATTADGWAAGGGALSSWRKTMAWVWLGR